MSLVDYASDEADSNEDEDEPGTAPGPAVHGDAAAGASSSDSVAMSVFEGASQDCPAGCSVATS